MGLEEQGADVEFRLLGVQKEGPEFLFRSLGLLQTLPEPGDLLDQVLLPDPGRATGLTSGASDGHQACRSIFRRGPSLRYATRSIGG
jgi:hypothetical protein